MDAYWMRGKWGDGGKSERRWNQGSRNPLTVIITGAVFFVGTGVVFAVGYLFPSDLVVAIILAFFVVMGVVFAIRGIMGHTGAYWYTLPFAALALLGTVMLAEDMALAQSGELTEVVVTDHHVEQKTVSSPGRTGTHEVYTHTYSLERTDGSPVVEPLIYRGESGYDDFDTGDTISVLIDPEGKAPTKPAEDVDLPADIGILVTGVVTSGIVFLICLIVVLLRWTRSPSQQHVR